MKRALLSCYDKTGIEVIAKVLTGLGAELIASDGTAKYLRDLGFVVKTVDEFTGLTEQLDGRVKTLHPKIHSGILALRDHPAHIEMAGIDNLIDMVVVNLYPFEDTIHSPGVTQDESLERIDIGGVALLRAAAKNFESVAVICSPDQYEAVAEALKEGSGKLTDEMKRELAYEAFHFTSAYDGCISGYLVGTKPEDNFKSISVRKQQQLRYGENPHQKAGWYIPIRGKLHGFASLKQLQGKELSYNNFLDMDAALRCLIDFNDPSVVIIKHASICGLASAENVNTAYVNALECDQESAFGGVIGVNRKVDKDLALTLSDMFIEVIVAPSVDPDALEIFSKKKNRRIVTLDWPDTSQLGQEWRQIVGGWLMQEPDTKEIDVRTASVKTDKSPTDEQIRDMLFALKAAKHVKSNGIVIAKNSATLGIGQGQPSRVGSVKIAIDKAGPAAKGAVAASDGFFPFADGLELLADSGVEAILQPGGSVRDDEVIEAAKKAGIVLVFTGQRNFKH